MAAAVFLVVNGIILFIGDKYATVQAQKKRDYNLQSTVEHTSAAMSKTRAGIIGTAQVLALIAGIIRSGVTMVSGLFSGLDYQDSARFSFLLATPIIFAAESGVRYWLALWRPLLRPIFQSVFWINTFALIASVRLLFTRSSSVYLWLPLSPLGAKALPSNCWPRLGVVQ